jgi:hypothetical protein
LEADFGEIGWLCITTFFKGGEFLQKRTTGAGGRNLKGEPSSCTGSGPSCCCRQTEQGYNHHCEPLQENLQENLSLLWSRTKEHRVDSSQFRRKSNYISEL